MEDWNKNACQKYEGDIGIIMFVLLNEGF